MIFLDTSKYNEGIYRSKQKFSKSYNELFSARAKKVARLLDGFEGTLLDVGCGDAEITLGLKNALHCQVKAVDLVKENVEKANAKGIDAKQVDLNSEGLPFKAASFDGLFAGEVLEHVVDSDAVLQEFKRVIKKDGALVLTVPNIACWYNRVLLLFGFLPHYIESGSRQSYGSPFGLLNGHVKAFTKGSIVEMLEKNGFKVERVSGSGLSKTGLEAHKGKGKTLSPLFFFFEKIASKRPGLATNVIVKARKL